MSHFSVAVFRKPGQFVEDLLAPYDESITVEPYIWKTRDEAVEFARKYYPDFTDSKSDEECWEYMAEDMQTDANGNILSTYNPDSKWDWWCEGGRWGNLLYEHGLPDDYLLTHDDVRVGDMPFSTNKEGYQDALNFWHEYVDSAQDFEYKESYIARYGTAETYAKTVGEFGTYAVITPDGEWHSMGNMGYFGISSETDEEAAEWYANYRKRFIETADPDWLITIVDCHI